jgi:uncharacterized protein YrzB (UPF0473 family)
MSDEDVVILTDDEGTEVRFLHIMTFDFEDSFYVALTPEESVEGIENGEVLILEIMEDEDGDDCYVPIEDDAKMDKVWAEFERLYYEDEDGDDDDDEDDGHSCDDCCGCDKSAKQD